MGVRLVCYLFLDELVNKICHYRKKSIFFENPMMRLYSLDYLSAPDASFTLMLEELAKKNTICSIAFLKLHPKLIK